MTTPSPIGTYRHQPRKSKAGIVIELQQSSYLRQEKRAPLNKHFSLLVSYIMPIARRGTLSESQPTS